ncbi:CRISPR-associated endonuclease Cas3'' [Paracoccaceae bacterium]|nr:CRISPR-associated endonuclease Cas3'' [Paracoccaceae bacterium]
MDCSNWELLSKHLLNIACLAQKFASPFDGSKLVEATGILHDVGKARPAFQKKLNGETNAETHSSEGAKYACDDQSGLGL